MTDLRRCVKQVSGVDEGLLKQAAKQLRPGTVAERGPGYFKVARRHTLKPGIQAAAGANQRAEDSALVVAFGSAPGVPNWGGLLKRVELAGTADPSWQSFDVLFVVDGSRSWYDGMFSGHSKAPTEAMCSSCPHLHMLAVWQAATTVWPCIRSVWRGFANPTKP